MTLCGFLSYSHVIFARKTLRNIIIYDYQLLRRNTKEPKI